MNAGVRFFRRLLILFFIAVLALGCGYRFGQGDLPRKYSTITVPYVIGDKTGELTAAIIRKISQSGGLRYCKDSAQLTLCVKVINYYDENVGFRYDRTSEDELTHSIIPTETRINLITEVTVTDNYSGCTLLGPAQIYGHIDFDHDYYYSRDAVNIFSLGQVTDFDAAHDAVQRPLNELLAEKITDYIIHSW